MDLLILLLSFISPLNNNACLYKSLSELILARLKMPSFTINSAQRRGILNFIQDLRSKLVDMSFKEVSDNLSLYLLWKYPPKCVFEFEKRLFDFSIDMDFKGIDQLNIDLNNPDWALEVNKSINLAKCYV